MFKQAKDDVRLFYQAGNIVMAGGSPRQCGKRIRRDFAFHSQIAKEAKISPQ
jgi:hypothetical protein